RCLRRRIAVRMRARGVHTYDEYRRVLDTDPHEYDLLLDALTINVTKFFRNLETWQALAPRLAALWTERAGQVRVWSAGCASGEEPYTVAVALAEAARQRGQETLLERARVDATDIDRASLERTRAAAFPEAAFSEMPPELTPGGILVLGKVETLFGPARQRLVLEEPRERIYRRARSG